MLETLHVKCKIGVFISYPERHCYPLQKDNKSRCFLRHRNTNFLSLCTVEEGWISRTACFFKMMKKPRNFKVQFLLGNKYKALIRNFNFRDWI